MPEGSTPRPASSEARPAGRPTPPPLPGSSRLPAPSSSLSDVQGMQKAPPKRVAPPADFSAPPAGEDVTVRTMKDDLATAPQPTAVASETQDSTSPTEEKPTFPLPPTSKSSDGKGPKTPLPPQQNTSSATLIILGVIVLISILSAGGVVGWFYLDRAPATPEEDVSAPSNAPALTEMIPAAAEGVVTFAFADAEARTELLSTWGAAADGTTVAEIVAGDPRPLFANPDINQAAYIFLPNGSVDPYLIVPDTPISRTLFQNTAGVSSVEERGWLVVHPADPSTYIGALAEGSLARAGQGGLLTSEPLATVGLSASSAVLNTARTQFGTLAQTTSQLQSLELTGIAGSTNASFAFSGTAGVASTTDTSPADQQLLSFVPDRARLVELGGNFSERAGQFLNTTADAQTAPVTLLSQLTLPYALYLHDLESFGLIVQFPASQPPLLDNIEIEQLLELLVPLLGGTPSTAPREYNASTYAEVPLRYSNLKGTTSAIDYAVIEPYLLVATSKDSMTTLLDTVTSARESVTSGLAWRDVLSAWGAPPAAPRMLLGRGGMPLFDRILPGASARTSFGFALSPSTESTMGMSGVVTVMKGDPLTPDVLPQ